MKLSKEDIKSAETSKTELENPEDWLLKKHFLIFLRRRRSQRKESMTNNTMKPEKQKRLDCDFGGRFEACSNGRGVF